MCPLPEIQDGSFKGRKIDLGGYFVEAMGHGWKRFVGEER
jgi:hypothetical protein